MKQGGGRGLALSSIGRRRPWWSPLSLSAVGPTSSGGSLLAARFAFLPLLLFVLAGSGSGPLWVSSITKPEDTTRKHMILLVPTYVGRYDALGGDQDPSKISGAVRQKPRARR